MPDFSQIQDANRLYENRVSLDFMERDVYIAGDHRTHDESETVCRPEKFANGGKLVDFFSDKVSKSVKEETV